MKYLLKALLALAAGLALVAAVPPPARGGDDILFSQTVLIPFLQPKDLFVFTGVPTTPVPVSPGVAVTTGAGYQPAAAAASPAPSAPMAQAQPQQPALTLEDIRKLIREEREAEQLAGLPAAQGYAAGALLVSAGSQVEPAQPAPQPAPPPAGGRRSFRPQAPDTAQFRLGVAAFLRNSCAACHTAGARPKAGFALFNNQGQAVFTDGQAATILDAVTREDNPMPPRGPKLSAQQIAALRGWKNAVAARNGE